MLNLIKSLAAANGIQCKCVQLYVNNAEGVLVSLPWKQLAADNFMEMLMPDGATAEATGLGLITITRSL